jgi:outer membrane protein insertion porin family
MSVKQTSKSASLVALLLAASTGTALADPEDAEPGQPAGEVRDDGDTKAPGQTEPASTPSAPDPPPPPPKRIPTGRFQVGAGFSTDENFIATATIAQDNLFQTGQRLALTATISQRRQLFLLDHAIPLGDGLELRTQLYAKDEAYPGFHRKAAGGSALLDQKIGAHLHAFTGYRLENVTAEVDDPVSARGDVPGLAGDRDVTIASLRSGLVYSTLDQPYMPTKGMLLGTSIEVADRWLGSDVQLTRIDGWGSIHKSVGPFIAHLGGSVSAISSRDPGGVPLSERLFLNRSNLVRGYGPGEIGPRNGGNFEFTARGELELPVIPRLGISLVGFIDHGGIFDRSGSGSTGTSAGVGILWRSPIGPLRFDWALPLDGTRPIFTFGIGASF